MVMLSRLRTPPLCLVMEGFCSSRCGTRRGFLPLRFQRRNSVKRTGGLSRVKPNLLAPSRPECSVVNHMLLHSKILIEARSCRVAARPLSALVATAITQTQNWIPTGATVEIISGPPSAFRLPTCQSPGTFVPCQCHRREHGDDCGTSHPF